MDTNTMSERSSRTLSNISQASTSAGKTSEANTSEANTSDISELYRASQIKPNCVNCEKPITDVIVVALGETWHPEHFTCAHCNEPMRETTFRTHKEKPYCEKDYLKLFVKICCACHERIKGTVLTAFGDTWHQECFKCTDCGRIIGLKEFTEKGCSPYCMICAAKTSTTASNEGKTATTASNNEGKTATINSNGWKTTTIISYTGERTATATSNKSGKTATIASNKSGKTVTIGSNKSGKTATITSNKEGETGTIASSNLSRN